VSLSLIGHHGCSADDSERWVKDARPRRSYKLFKIRAEKEKATPPQKILKRDSDYYYHTRLVLRAEAEKLRESQLVSSTPSTQQGDAGPSTQASRNASQLSHITATPASQPNQDDKGKSKPVGKAVVKGKEKAKEEKTVDPALATLFEDDVIVAVDSPEERRKKKKKQDKDGGDLNSPAKSEIVKDKEKKEKKRKRESGLAESVTTGSGPSSRRTSPEKKKRVASPIKSSAAVASTPQLVPPTPITAGITSGPSRSARSPNPPTAPRRSKQEPLFLDSGPSPADTFGEPMPGFFDSRPQSRISSLSLSQPASTSLPNSLPTPLPTAKIEPVDPEPSQRGQNRGTTGISHDADSVIDLAEEEEEEEESVNNALLEPEVVERPKSRSLSPLPPVEKVLSPAAQPAILHSGTHTAKDDVSQQEASPALGPNPTAPPASTSAITGASSISIPEVAHSIPLPPHVPTENLRPYQRTPRVALQLHLTLRPVMRLGPPQLHPLNKARIAPRRHRLRRRIQWSLPPNHPTPHRWNHQSLHSLVHEKSRDLHLYQWIWTSLPRPSNLLSPKTVMPKE
jgi:hypothetical protein